MNVAEIKDHEQGFGDIREKNLGYEVICGGVDVHVNEVKAETQGGAKLSWESQETQGVGKACVRPRESSSFYSTLFLHSL